MPDFRILTVSQPHAGRIASGEKWVENRTWETGYRGLIVIHAGKGTQYMTREELDKVPHACCLAVARLESCLNVAAAREALMGGVITARDLEVLQHQYTEGPVAWVLADIAAFPEPIEASGKQGLWLPGPRLREQLEEAIERVGMREQ